MPTKPLALCGVLTLAAALLWPAGAGAGGIKCRNGYQAVGGNLIATPYCQDALLAQVAREHGMSASAARVRNNPNYKREVCRFVGNDIRISEHCLNEAPSIRGRGF